ncbi:tyrosine-type recombinase/integrase [Neptuniibacter sp. QD48_11]|uniref:tyrosine-type recombinase/integrase n=1 Tax=Neptuniibacter sp. QD48_11 TaxID=3398211 RepID=UPI0039F4ACAE
MYYDIKLTKKALDNIERIDDKDTEYRAIGKHHLRVRVHKNRVSLAVRANINNRRPSKTLGTYPEMDLKTFERLGDEWLRQQKNIQGPDYSCVTYDEFFFQIHLEYVKQRNTDWRKTEQQYRHYVQPYLGSDAFTELPTFSCLKVLNAMHQKGLSNATINRVRSLMHRSFSLGIKFGVVNRNPCSAIEKFTEDNVVERILTNEELPAFLVAALEEVESIHVLALLLALLTGGRIGNIISLQKADLMPDLSSLTFTKTKSKKKQVVPLSDQARWVLKKALSLSPSDSPYVFSSHRGEAGHIKYPVGAFKRICERAQIATTGAKYAINPLFPQAPLTIHCLRKSFGSAVQEHTNDIHCSSKLLGHSSVDVTSSRYAFFQQSTLNAATQGAASVITKDLPNFPKIDSGSH